MSQSNKHANQPTVSSHVALKDRQDPPDLSRMIENFGCTAEFEELENCLAEHDRSWSKCRAQVKSLAQCNKKEHAATERG